MFRKKTILFFSFLVLSVTLHAQTIQVKKEKTRIEKDYADGFEVVLDGATYEEANAALVKQMKIFGKTKTSSGYIGVNEPTVQEKKYTTAVYGAAKQLGNIISVWIGIKTDDWSKDEAGSVNRDLEKNMRDFGINFHREKIQKQIDESVRASQAVERQKQRLSNQNRDLTTKISDNQREKIQLEKSLVNNKTELENLTKRLEKNKKDQDSVAVAGDQIKKVIEMHRDRQGKVN